MAREIVQVGEFSEKEYVRGRNVQGKCHSTLCQDRGATLPLPSL